MRLCAILLFYGRLSLVHNGAVIRPCFLVIDPEFPGTISTRKLVIETAKFNVITVYSGHEAIETLRRFPRLHGVVMDARVPDIPCAELSEKLRAINPEIPIVITSGRGYDDCGPTAHHLETYDPKDLLNMLKALYPEQTAQIMQHDEGAL